MASVFIADKKGKCASYFSYQLYHNLNHYSITPFVVHHILNDVKTQQCVSMFLSGWGEFGGGNLLAEEQDMATLLPLTFSVV